MAGVRGSNSTSFSLPLLQMFGERKRSGHAESNGFPGNANLPDLVQQSHTPLATPSEGPGRHSSLLGQDLDSVAEVGDSAACQSKPPHLLTSNPTQPWPLTSLTITIWSISKNEPHISIYIWLSFLAVDSGTPRSRQTRVSSSSSCFILCCQVSFWIYFTHTLYYSYLIYKRMHHKLHHL